MGFIETRPLKTFSATTSTEPAHKGRVFEDEEGKRYKLVQNKQGGSLSAGEVVKIDATSNTNYEVVKCGDEEKADGVVKASTLADDDYGFIEVGGIGEPQYDATTYVSGQYAVPAASGQAKGVDASSITAKQAPAVMGVVLEAVSSSGNQGKTKLYNHY